MRCYFNARWYDAEMGRFTSRDPEELPWSPYAFVNNSPLVFIDTTGRAPEPFTVITTIPLSFWNMYQTQKYMMQEQGAGPWAATGGGLAAFAVTWGVSLMTMPGAASYTMSMSRWLAPSFVGGATLLASGAGQLALKSGGVGALSGGLTGAATQLTLHGTDLGQWDQYAIASSTGSGFAIGFTGGLAAKLGYSALGASAVGAEMAGFVGSSVASTVVEGHPMGRLKFESAPADAARVGNK